MATLLEKLQTAQLPVVSATEAGEIVMEAMTSAQQITFSDILLEHFQPLVYAARQTTQADIQQLKNQYLAAMNQLQGIQDWTTPSNATVVAGVKQLADISAKTLKILKTLV